MAFVKGAPPRGAAALHAHPDGTGKIRPWTTPPRDRDPVKANDDYARNALRVLALAQRRTAGRTGAIPGEAVEQGLTFLGLAA